MVHLFPSLLFAKPIYTKTNKQANQKKKNKKKHTHPKVVTVLLNTLKELKLQLPALTCYFLTSVTSSSARLVGPKENPGRWFLCLLLLFSLPCSGETCGYLFLFQLCLRAFSIPVPLQRRNLLL